MKQYSGLVGLYNSSVREDNDYREHGSLYDAEKKTSPQVFRMLACLILFILTLVFVTKSQSTESFYWTSEHFRQALAPTTSKPVIFESDIYAMMDNELKGLFYSSELPKNSVASRLPLFNESSSFMLEPRMQETVIVGQMCFIQTRMSSRPCGDSGWPSGLRCADSRLTSGSNQIKDTLKAKNLGLFEPEPEWTKYQTKGEQVSYSNRVWG